MTQDLAKVVDEVQVTDKQRDKFLALIKADTAVGSVDALRQAGVAGTRGQLRTWLRDNTDLEQAAREARGWNLNRVEAAAWTVAVDTDHPAWDRANARILKAYHPSFRDQAHVDVNHTGEVRNPDVAEAVERLNALVSAAALRAATREPAGELPPGTD